jgi:hypothetical protein
LAEAALSHCLIEGDFLDLAHPEPWGHSLAERNLADMWSNYRALGYRRMVYTNTISVLRDVIERVIAAIGDDPKVNAVLLSCSDHTAHQRLSREVGSTLDEHVLRSAEMAELLANGAPWWVHRLDTDDRSVADLATHIIGWTGWLGGAGARCVNTPTRG